jgi:hypothetical protein
MLMMLDQGLLPEWLKKPDALAISIGDINLYENSECYMQEFPSGNTSNTLSEWNSIY